MNEKLDRREFLQLTAAGCAVSLAGSDLVTFGAASAGSKLVSPGCRGSKVKVARIYIGIKNKLHCWPQPNLDLPKEVRFYESQFAELKNELADVDFVVDELVTGVEELGPLRKRLQDADGILVIHLTTGINRILDEILKLGNFTMFFARPYSGHEWTRLGELRKRPLGAKMDCVLTSDFKQLAAAIWPFRAIHHLREAKILNLTEHSIPAVYVDSIRQKFGTEIKVIDLKRVLAAYEAVSDNDAKAEAERWIQGAEKVVEPSRDNILKSCRLALAFENVLDEENATVMTADCYGSMFEPLCRAYAFPCIGFTRLNNMGLGGICESDLQSAITHILFQGLSGRPGFISDPTIDESSNCAILAHCLGTMKMDGPAGPAAGYKLRTIMERQEGTVAQVQMRLGRKVTQARLIGSDLLLYFTGEIVGTPVSLEDSRGCRTKIAVKVDGDIEKLWRNWSNGLHRLTCYGDITKDLERFCRFKEIKMVNEAV